MLGDGAAEGEVDRSLDGLLLGSRVKVGAWVGSSLDVGLSLGTSVALVGDRLGDPVGN